MPDRRDVSAGLAGLVCAALAPAALVPAARAATGGTNAWGFFFEGLKGDEIRLADFRGKPVLVVNTASRCGYTPQYAGLQQLWTRFGSRGLTVIGVPSNDFGGQEPGGVAEIVATEQGYGVTFPMATKTQVLGVQAHPFYRWAAAEKPGETPRWNFHKYLVGRDGRVAASIPTTTEPTDPRVIAAITRELPTLG
ncbi:MAG: glutathione peroxidase [Alsobacter sp.]